MKVDLEKIRLAVTAISKNVVATIPNKDGLTMKHKQDVTSDFLQAIVDYGKNTRFNIATENNTDNQYQVCVKKVTNHKTEIFTRKEVVDLLSQFTTTEWIDEHLL